MTAAVFVFLTAFMMRNLLNASEIARMQQFARILRTKGPRWGRDELNGKEQHRRQHNGADI